MFCILAEMQIILRRNRKRPPPLSRHRAPPDKLLSEFNNKGKYKKNFSNNSSQWRGFRLCWKQNGFNWNNDIRLHFRSQSVQDEKKRRAAEETKRAMEEQKRKLEEEEEKRRSEEAKVIWSAGMFWFQCICSLCKRTYCSPKGERRRGSMEGRADQHGIARSQLVSI